MVAPAATKAPAAGKESAATKAPAAGKESAATRETAARALNCRGRRLEFHTPGIMGVLNITPDSFSDGGENYLGDAPDVGAVRERALAMLEDGAAILDVGGESTRPGAAPVALAEELRRVMPVVETLLDLDTIVSVDTCKPEVARVVLEAGCHMINDVSGLGSARMRKVLGDSSAAVCIMHMGGGGNPRTMQSKPSYSDVIGEIRAVLTERVAAARSAGIEGERICIDPGFGFGKSLDHNLTLLRNLEAIRIDGLPLLAGLSRKGMIGLITDRSVTERLAGSITAAVLAAQNGADLVRVHDVAETADALKILEAVTP